MQKQSKELSIVASIGKNVAKKKWKCIVEGCNQTSINSHLLQLNGILDNVIQDGHLYEYTAVDPFVMEKTGIPLKLKKTGKKKAFSLDLFCKQHDSSLFKEIETAPIDIESYRSHLLLSYRVIAAEIRKKEINIEKRNRLLNAESLKGKIDRPFIEESIKNTESGIKDLKELLSLTRKDLDENTKDFTFKAYKYDFLDVYCSAVFSPIDYNVEFALDDPYNNVFIHIIPYNDCLNIIVGYCNKYVDTWIKDYVNSWRNLNNVEVEYKITNLFCSRIENWGISPGLYNEIKEENFKLFDEYLQRNILNYSLNQETNFNLFENKYGT